MDLQALFNSLRCPSFSHAICQKRKDLAHFLVLKNETIQSLSEKLEASGRTGKNEMIAKIIHISGGTNKEVPTCVVDAAKQLKINISLDIKIQTQWQQLLESSKRVVPVA